MCWAFGSMEGDGEDCERWRRVVEVKKWEGPANCSLYKSFLRFLKLSNGQFSFGEDEETRGKI